MNQENEGRSTNQENILGNGKINQMGTSDLTVIYLCNAVDEETKTERNIPFASPAETNKVFQVVKAMQTQAMDVSVLSLGRGSQTGDGTKFAAAEKTIGNVKITYAAFWHLPIFTHLIGALSMASIFMSLVRDTKSPVAVIAYNRLFHYIPTLVLAKLYRKNCFLDLEDGKNESTRLINRVFGLFSKQVFNFLCNQGALIATNSLRKELGTKRIVVCYGCTEFSPERLFQWDSQPVQILFGGTLMEETGARLLIDTIEILNSNYPEINGRLLISVTGQGPMSTELERYAKANGKGWINFYGSIDRASYRQLIHQSHAGLSLRMPTSEYGRTTFPSKIIEFASHGLLIISTKVNDVPELLDKQSAILLSEATPECLASDLNNLVLGFYDAGTMAEKGKQRIFNLCNYEIVGRNLKKLLLMETIV
jgi:glycosyltransferase involved in cell wall biosynthesis